MPTPEWAEFSGKWPQPPRPSQLSSSLSALEQARFLSQDGEAPAHGVSSLPLLSRAETGAQAAGLWNLVPFLSDPPVQKVLALFFG